MSDAEQAAIYAQRIMDRDQIILVMAHRIAGAQRSLDENAKKFGRNEKIIHAQTQLAEAMAAAGRASFV